MRSPSTATSPSVAGPPVPSTMVALRITRSGTALPLRLRARHGTRWVASPAMASETFQQRLDALVGQPMGGGNVAPDPVNLPMIRHWVAAFDDRNPAYLDADAAATTRWGDVVAPPMMLQ